MYCVPFLEESGGIWSVCATLGWFIFIILNVVSGASGVLWLGSSTHICACSEFHGILGRPQSMQF